MNSTKRNWCGMTCHPVIVTGTKPLSVCRFDSMRHQTIPPGQAGHSTPVLIDRINAKSKTRENKMKAKHLFHTLGCLTLLAGATIAHAGSHTWSGAINNAWGNAGNWSAGGAPQYGEPNV